MMFVKYIQVQVGYAPAVECKHALINKRKNVLIAGGKYQQVYFFFTAILEYNRLASEGNDIGFILYITMPQVMQ